MSSFLAAEPAQSDRASTQNQRVYWVDLAKGMGIALVVFGHTLRGVINSGILPANPLLTFVDSWIYAFHMPLFFLISGLFIDRSTAKPLRSFFSTKLAIIAYPYFVWSLLQSVLQIAAGGSTNSSLGFANLWKISYEPVMQFWFLYVLFAIEILYATAAKLGLPNRYFLGFAVLLYVAHIGGVNFGTWGVLYLLRRYAVYFAIGAVISRPLLNRSSQMRSSHLGAIVGLGYAAVTLAVGLNLTDKVAWVPFIALVGMSATLALAMLLDRAHLASVLRSWGMLSLQIYVAHTIASSTLRIVLQKLGFVEPYTHLILGTAIGIYVPIALAQICDRFGFRYLFAIRPPKLSPA